MKRRYRSPEREFDDFALRYDTTVMSPDYGYGGVERMFNTVSGFLLENPYARVLDAGCGTGLIGQKLKTEFPDVDLIGIDISAKMRTFARKKGVYSQLKKVNLEKDRFPFADSSFDLVVSSATFDYVRKPEKAFNEMSRVLRSGGGVAFTTFAGLSEASRDARKKLDAMLRDSKPTGVEEFEHTVAYVLDEMQRAGLPVNHLERYKAFNSDDIIASDQGGTFYHMFSNLEAD